MHRKIGDLKEKLVEVKLLVEELKRENKMLGIRESQQKETLANHEEELELKNSKLEEVFLSI